MENTNKKRYWLEWGKIFFSLSVLLFLINLGCGTGKGGFENFGCMVFYIPMVIPISPFGSLFDSLRLEEPLETYVAMVVGVILWTILGLILGWIYGKIKNRKSAVSQSNV